MSRVTPYTRILLTFLIIVMLTSGYLLIPGPTPMDPEPNYQRTGSQPTVFQRDDGLWELVSYRGDDPVRGASVEVLEQGDDHTTIELSVNNILIDFNIPDERMEITLPEAHGLAVRAYECDDVVALQVTTHIALPLGVEPSLVRTISEDPIYLSTCESTSPSSQSDPNISIIRSNMCQNKIQEENEGSNLSAKLGKAGMLRDLHVMEVTFFPFSVGDGYLKLDQRIRVELVWDQDENEGPVWSGSGRPVDNEFSSLYQESILNYEHIADKLVVSDESGARRARRSVTIPDDLLSTSNRADYMMVVNSTYFQGVLPLANHRSGKFEVCVINDTAIYAAFPHTDRSVSIRSFIGHAITSWELGPTYVTLVGDAAWLPIHYYLESLKSDHYYAAAVGDDVYPDVALGRLSVTTNEELDAVVSKLINYDTSPPSGDWREEILLTAHEGFNEDDVYRKNQEEVRHNLLNSTYGAFYNVSTAYAGEGNKLQYFIDKMNQGVFFMSYRGHGTPFIWDSANLALNTTSILCLQNNLSLPMVTSLTCSNADVTYPTCVGEAFLRAPNGGSIGFLGATGITFTYPHVDYEKFLYNSTFADGHYTFGMTIFRAKVKTLFKWGSDPSAEENIKMSLFLGDPATTLVRPQIGPRPDLRITPGEIQFTKENPQEGEVVIISLEVENKGSTSVSGVTLSIFKGDPDMGGTRVGQLLRNSAIDVNGTWHVQYPWNTSTTGGTFKIFAWVDANNSIIEQDEENNWAWKEIHVKTTSFSMDLSAGWNLISCPLVPLDPSVDSFFASIAGSYDKVFTCEAEGGKVSWRGHVPPRPIGLDGMRSVSNTMGLWVHMSEPATLEVEGINASSGANIPLAKGWNLVGYPSIHVMTVAQLRGDVQPCNSIMGYDNDIQPGELVELGDADTLETGDALWVHVEEDYSWDVLW